MAHQLSTASGEVEFASTRPAWHKLGTIVQEAMTAEQAIKLAHLDWPVQQMSLHLENGVKIPDRIANCRLGRELEPVYLGTVGRTYQVIQNVESFSFMDVLVGRGQAVFETAGAIQNGKRVFISAKLPGDLIVGEADRTERYLLLMNAHDGTSACRCLFTPTRVVCANTLRIALGRAGDSGISIRHSGDVKTKIAEAERVLSSACHHFDELQALFIRWRAAAMDRSAAKKFFEELLPIDTADGIRTVNRIERSRDEMMQSFVRGPGSDMASSSVWGAYNAAVDFVDNIAWRHRPGSSPDSRFASTLYGAGAALKQKAADMLLMASD